MNKLISKNPVLRFKEGRKIIKAERGVWGKLWDLITDTDLAYTDNPAVMTAAGHTSRVSGAHTPTAEERRLGENLTEIGKAGAAAVGGEALQAIKGALSTGRAVSTVKNTRAVSNPTVSTVSLGLRALPGRVSTPNVPAVRSNVPAVRGNVRPNTITVEGRTISSRALPSRSSTLGRKLVGTTMAAYPAALLMSSDSNSKNNVALGTDMGANVGTSVGANIASNMPDKNRVARRHDYGKGEVTYNLDKNTGIWYAKWNDPTKPNLGWYKVAEGSTGYNRAGDHNVLRNGKWVKITTPTQKNAVPVDWNKNYNNFKNGLTTALRAWLTNEGVDYNNVESVQKYLLGKLGNNALGKWGADNKWGKASQAAWNKLASQTDFTPKVNISPELIEKDRQTIINLALPQSKLPTVPEGGISNFAPLSTTKPYNRADVRDFIRNKGINPYNFSGDQRKALRMIINGQGTDEDKALVQSMGIFKKGGVLPSRNPITRFKNRKSN